MHITCFLGKKGANICPTLSPHTIHGSKNGPSAAIVSSQIGRGPYYQNPVRSHTRLPTTTISASTVPTPRSQVVSRPSLLETRSSPSSYPMGTGNLPWPPPSVLAGFPEANFVDPPQRTWLPYYAITLHVIASLMVFIRWLLRWRKKCGGFGIDDLLLFPAWLGATLIVAAGVYGTKHNLNTRHIWDVPPSDWDDAALVSRSI
jgi:hypothetical protein